MSTRTHSRRPGPCWSKVTGRTKEMILDIDLVGPRTRRMLEQELADTNETLSDQTCQNQVRILDSDWLTQINTELSLVRPSAGPS